MEQLADGDVTLHAGDAIEVLGAMGPASVDAVVTDPPYGLEFMGQDWDRFTGDVRQPGDDSYAAVDNPYGRSKVRSGMGGAYGTSNPGARFGAWCETWAGEMWRVTKPGGYAVVFGGSRTWHRLACALEDAGWEIRDTITWLYGSGFPKSLNVSKAIDARLGAERPVVGQLDVNAAMRGGNFGAGTEATRDLVDVTAPGSREARDWQGWGTALKPGFEPIIVARRPLSEKSVADNVLKHGTGAINVDGCRTPMDAADRAEAEGKNRHADFGSGARDNAVYGAHNVDRADQGNWSGDAGRWPTNVLLSHGEGCQLLGYRTVASNSHHPAARPAGGIGNDGHAGQDDLTERRPVIEAVEAWACAEGCPVAELDRQSGTSRSSGHKSGTFAASGRSGGIMGEAVPRVQESVSPADAGGASRFFPRFRYSAKAGDAERPSVDGVEHPTVKPLELMRWLVRLVSAEGAIVLDPFAGSGTTGHAAVLEGRRAVLIERAPEYLPLIRSRFAGPLAPALF